MLRSNPYFSVAFSVGEEPPYNSSYLTVILFSIIWKSLNSSHWWHAFFFQNYYEYILLNIFSMENMWGILAPREGRRCAQSKLGLGRRDKKRRINDHLLNPLLCGWHCVCISIFITIPWCKHHYPFKDRKHGSEKWSNCPRLHSLVSKNQHSHSGLHNPKAHTLSHYTMRLFFGPRE